MGLFAQQRLVLVLTVNIDEHFAEHLQLLHGAGLAIDVTARSAFDRVQAAEYAVTVAVEIL